MIDQPYDKIFIDYKKSNTCFLGVTLDDRSVVTVSEQKITCSISDLSQETLVTWIDPDNNDISDSDTDNYVISQGTYSSGSKSSTLTITKSKLAGLTSGDTFKCKLKSALYPTNSPEVVKSMVLSLLSLGWYQVMLLLLQILTVAITVIL